MSHEAQYIYWCKLEDLSPVLTWMNVIQSNFIAWSYSRVCGILSAQTASTVASNFVILDEYSTVVKRLEVWTEVPIVVILHINHGLNGHLDSDSPWEISDVALQRSVIANRVDMSSLAAKHKHNGGTNPQSAGRSSGSFGPWVIGAVSVRGQQADPRYQW